MCTSLKLPDGQWVDRQGELRAALRTPAIYAAVDLTDGDDVCLCPVNKDLLAACMDWDLSQNDVGDFIATPRAPLKKARPTTGAGAG